VIVAAIFIVGIVALALARPVRLEETSEVTDNNAQGTI
jgi:hypothetical protein